MREKGQLSRRDLLRAGALLGVGSLVAACGPGGTTAPSPSTAGPGPASGSPAAAASTAAKSLDELEAAAKKETGPLLVYFPGTRDLATVFVDRFTKKYSWAPKIDTFVGTSGVLGNKILTEALTGAPTADVFMIPGTFREQMLANKAITPVQIQGDRKMPKDLIDQDGYSHPVYELLETLVYNTNLVKTPPKDPFDLADPSWSGKICFDKPQNLAISAIFLSAWRPQWGDKKWIEWLQGLQANKIFLTASGGDSYETIVRGDRAIGIGTSNDVASQKPGTPAAADYQFPPVPFIQQAWLSSRAKRPATAQLFLEFIASEDGQQGVASTGRTPVLPLDVPTSAKNILPSGISVMPGTQVGDFYSRTSQYMTILNNLWPA